MTFLADGDTEQRCRELAELVPLPSPCTPADLAQAVAEMQGWQITLADLPDRYGVEISGECLRTDSGFVLRYPHGSHSVFGLTTVAHELGHLLLGHLGERSPSSTARRRAVDALLPDLQLAHETWVLYRCSLPELDEEPEREAELVGSFLVERIALAAARAAPQSGAGRVARLVQRSRARRTRDDQ